MAEILTGEKIPVDLVQKLEDLLSANPKSHVLFLGGKSRDYQVPRAERQILHHSDEEFKKAIPAGTVGIVVLSGNLSHVREIAGELPSQGLVVGYNNQNGCKTVFAALVGKRGAIRAEATRAQQLQAQELRLTLAKVATCNGGSRQAMVRSKPALPTPLEFCPEAMMSDSSRTSETGSGTPPASPPIKKRLIRGGLQHLICELFEGRIDSVRPDTVIKEIHRHQSKGEPQVKSSRTSIINALNAVRGKGMTVPLEVKKHQKVQKLADKSALPSPSEPSKAQLIRKIGENVETLGQDDLQILLEVTDALKKRRLLREISS